MKYKVTTFCLILGILFFIIPAHVYAWSCGDMLTDTRDNKSYSTVLIGTQCWMRSNLNVGTLINVSGNQGTSCSSIQKYCSGNNESNCDTYGGLYQWNQAMCGSTTPGTIGICPSGWHLPTHDEFTTLESSICTSESCATDFPYDTSTTGWRGTNEGTTLQINDSTHFSAIGGGAVYYNSFYNLTSYSIFWTSIEGGWSSAWFHQVTSNWQNSNQIYRSADDKTTGYSVRCIQDPQFTITSSAGANGSISPSGGTSVSIGQSQSYTITPNAHYHIANVLVDGSSVGVVSSYNFTNVTSAHTISVTFAIDTYTVSFSAGLHGFLSGTTTQTVAWGDDSSQVTAAGFTGFHFTDWSDGSTQNPRQITAVTSNKSITANFAADDPSLPTISNLSASPLSDSAVITWTTSKVTDSKIEYGLNSAYGFATDNLEVNPTVLSHHVTLTDLKPYARYYYRAISEDMYGVLAISDQKVFLTAGCAASNITGGTETILPISGGSLELINHLNTAKLIIPNNYFLEQATFQLNKLDINNAPSGVDGKTLTSTNLYDLVAVTDSDQQLTSFDSPITFTITYGSDTLVNFVESSLDVYKYNGSSWEKKNCALNTAAHTLTCSLSGFSVYGVLGEPVSNSSIISSTSSSSSSQSPASSTPGCHDAPPLSAPDLFEIDAKQKTATLFFTPLSDTSHYYFSFSEKTDAEKHGADVMLAREGVQNYTVNLLKPNTVYYFKVRGQTGCMPGPWSNIMQVKTNSSTYYRYSSTVKTDIASKVKPVVTVNNEVADKKKISPTQETTQKQIYKQAGPIQKSQSNKNCFLLWCW